MFFKKKKDERIYAPVSGSCVELSQVPDPMFSKGVLGEGVAFRYEQDTLYSPCDGTIIVVAGTFHAIGIRSITGVELLLHVGVDTVNLEGKGFTVLVKQGQNVKAGTPLLRIDRDFMKQQNIDLITPMVVTNGKDVLVEIQGIHQVVEQGITEIIHGK